MNLKRKILLALLIGFAVIQFIQPVRNKSGQILPTDILKMVSIPDSVQTLLKNACYDCHSNNTNYPWYVKIQPMGWLMAKHIRQGKEVLNFSEFGSYSTRRQQSKLKSIVDQLKDNAMPLSSYKWMHKKARLDEDEKILIIKWAQQLKDSLTQIK
jgi:hypothetical protein